MQPFQSDGNSQSGFTLVELMIVVAILGVLASIAIPLFTKHQHRSKSSEAKTNLSAIRVVEEANFSEHGVYIAAAAEPAVIPGASPADFDFAGSDFTALGWSPEGKVYFSYAVAVSADATGFTADAGADTDGDGLIQIWGYAASDSGGNRVAGALGCDPALLSPEVVGRCTANANVY